MHIFIAGGGSRYTDVGIFVTAFEALETLGVLPSMIKENGDEKAKEIYASTISKGQELKKLLEI